MENILKLVKEKNNKATLKKMKNTTKHKNALKGNKIHIIYYLLFIVTKLILLLFNNH